MELAEFVRARLDEDEQIANAATPGPWRATGEDILRRSADPYWDGMCAANATGADAAYIAHHDPKRALAEITAKRGRLTLMTDATADMNRLLADETASMPDRAMAIGRARAATVAVKHDATIWSDHDDYQARWSPNRTS